MRVLVTLVMIFALSAPAFAGGHAKDKGMDPAMMQQMVAQSMQIYDIADDVSIQDAIDSMMLRANTLNFKMVADLPLSEQVKAMGEDARYMRILAFCDALIAKKMVEFNPIFAGYLPCRIAVIEGADGKGKLVTMNMDMMLHAVELPPELKPLAQTVRDNIYSIIDAGVNGDL
ncbi:MAG: DUF302 domain-containing protein [bacterium]